MRNKRYSFWSNFRFMYQTIWKIRRSSVVLPVFEVILGIMAALVETGLPALVIGYLEAGWGFGRFAVMVLICFPLAGILHFAKAYLGPVAFENLVQVRILGPIYDQMKKSMTVDYERLEEEAVIEMQEKALESCQSNSTGFEGFVHASTDLGRGLLGLLVYSLMITAVQPMLVLVLLGIALLQLAVHSRVRRYELSHRNEKTKKNRFFSYFQKLAFEPENGKDIRLFSLRGWLMNIYEHQMDGLRSLIRRERLAYFAYDLLGLGLQLFRDIVCYGYLLRQLYDGMSAAQFVLYLGLVSGFSTWFAQIFDSAAKLHADSARVDDLRAWLDYMPVAAYGRQTVRQSEEGLDVAVDHVSYQYPGAKEPVLKDVSFHIHPGEKIALVGVNGAGKSTLIKLLCGLYRPTSGNIWINGVSLQELNPESYRQQLAVVFQDPILLPFTVGENISCEIPDDIDWERSWEVLKKAGLAEKVRGLPKGLRTYMDKVIDESGISLSGGEEQKLILARALYKQARLVLLDEPTAAMDSLAEQETYELYRTVLANQSAIFISHRLASTRFCDRILFMSEGRIQEEGNHEQLIKSRGAYAEMFKTQKQYYQRKGGEK